MHSVVHNICLSVCLSVTLRHSVKTAKHRLILSPGILTGRLHGPTGRTDNRIV